MTTAASSGSGTPGAAASGRGDFDAVAEVLRQHGDELRAIDGVVSVRAGYAFEGGWITNQPAVVVTVLPENLAAARQRIPAAYGAVPVDVTPATPTEQLRAAAADAAPRGAVRAAGVLPEEELALPGWDRGLQEGTQRGPAAGAERAAAHTYQGPPELKLSEVHAAMTVTCHASPDAGWPTLKAFLEKTRHHLTVAMYDFTAPHIRDTLRAAMAKADGALNLILDPGLSLDNGGAGNNPKAKDVTEDEIKDQLTQGLGKRFQFDWAAVKHQGKVLEGIFPSAYHIKVAVRDGEAFWLSSGNWQSSNQGPFDHFPPHAENGPVLGVYNREWHVVIEHPGLAGLYEKFILWDMKQADPLQDRSGVPGAEETAPELLVPDDAEERGPEKFFEPKEMKFTAHKPLRVQPLLTPDNYGTFIVPLLEGAKEKIFFQNQYIAITQRSTDVFDRLLDALLKQIKAKLDVRIILRDIGDSRKMLEALTYRGFPPSSIKLQKACHNKGIIVDSQIVALGSHNWSAAGTTSNRDASLIFHDPDVAAYYEKIFEYDWANQAVQKASAVQHPPVVRPRRPAAARGVEETAPNMKVVPWSAYYE